MRLLLAGITIVATCIGSRVSAEVTQSECLSDKAVQRLQSEFNWEFKNLSYPTLNACDPADLTYKVMTGLEYLRQLKFSSNPDPKDVIGARPFAYFKQRIRNIVFEAKGTGNCIEVKKGDVILMGVQAYVRKDDRSMHICEFFGEAQPLAMAQTLVHEARHTDDTGHLHIPCTHGHYHDFKEALCDDSLDDSGSYGVGFQFNRKFYQNKSASPVLRQRARSQALVDLLTRFNQLPLGLTEGALLQDRTGVLSFFNGDSVQMVASGKQSDLLVRHWGLPWKYNPLEGTATQVFPAEIPRNAQELYNYQVEFMTVLKATEGASSRDRELIDVHHGSSFSCFLFTSNLVCIDLQGGLHQLALEPGQTVALLTSANPTLFKADAVGLLRASGEFRILPESVFDLDKTSEGRLEVGQLETPLLRMEPWGSSLDNSIVLTAAGEVKLYSTSQRSLTDFTLLKGKTYKNLVSPYLYSRALRDL